MVPAGPRPRGSRDATVNNMVFRSLFLLMAALWTPLLSPAALAASDPVHVIVAPEEKPEAVTRLIETLRKTGEPFVLQFGGTQHANPQSLPAAGQRPVSAADTMLHT